MTPSSLLALVPLPKTIFLLLPAALLLYALALITYRLFFHALRHFPGPKLAAATYWYERYFDVFVPPQGQFMYAVRRMHDRYGPIVRINPDEIHVRDSEWFDVLYAGAGARRDRSARGFRSNGSSSSVMSALTHDLHRMRRAALNPFFSKRAISQLEPMIREKVDELSEGLSRCCQRGEVVELTTAFGALTLDVISEYCYSVCYDCLQSPSFAPEWRHAIAGLFTSVPVGKNFPLLAKILRSMPLAVAKKLVPGLGIFFGAKIAITAQAAEIFKDYHSNASEAKISTENTGPGADEEHKMMKTVYHSLLASNLPLREKTVDHMSNNAFILIVAGGETTAKVLTVITYYLLANRVILQRLRDELEEASSDGLPELKVLEQLPLLSAVIKEEPLKYHDRVIPAGTPKSMSLENVLFDAAIFPNPETFDPDRWIQAAKEGRKLDRYLVAFSKGTRQCLGMNLSYAEMYLALPTLVQRFDGELFDVVKERDIDTVRDCFVGMPSTESKGVRVKLREIANGG